MPAMITEWPRGMTVADYVRQYPDIPAVPAPCDECLPRHARTPFPELAADGTPCPVLSVDTGWLERRAAILRNRGATDARRLERAYAHGFVDGTPAIRADRLKRADLRRFA